MKMAALSVLAVVSGWVALAAAAERGRVCPDCGAELPAYLAVCPYSGVAPGGTPQEPLLLWTFEDNPGTLQGMGGAVMQLCGTDGTPKNGNGCLLVDLSRGLREQEQQTPGAVLWQPPADIGAVVFWARSPQGGRLMLTATESTQSKAVYYSVFTLARDRWQRIVIDSADMVPN